VNARALLLLLCVLPACAWTRRENRPVWNVFEEHLVPEEQGWFIAALPLTVPAGLLAILTDTFVAHPLQVTGDAWDDAGWLWRGGRPDFERRYYSEVAFVPVRAALTPVVLLGSFLGRSMFDIRDDESREKERIEAASAQRREFLDWIAAIAGGGGEPWHGGPPPLDAELRAALADARQKANALGRLQLYRFGARKVAGAIPELDPVLGLRDGSPAVRFTVLAELPREHGVPAELQAQLRDDPDEAVRVLARLRWPPQ
jgi:hypothetical protein